MRAPGAETQGADSKVANALARRRVDEVQLVVGPQGDEPLAVGREGEPREEEAVAASEAVLDHAALEVPDQHFRIEELHHHGRLRIRRQERDDARAAPHPFLQHLHLSAGDGVQDAQGAVGARYGKGLAVAAELDRGKAGRIHRELLRRLAGIDVPERDLVAMASAQQRLAVGAEDEAGDRRIRAQPEGPDARHGPLGQDIPHPIATFHRPGNGRSGGQSDQDKREKPSCVHGCARRAGSVSDRRT